MKFKDFNLTIWKIKRHENVKNITRVIHVLEEVISDLNDNYEMKTQSVFTTRVMKSS